MGSESNKNDNYDLCEDYDLTQLPIMPKGRYSSERMSKLANIITTILHEIYNSPGLHTASRARVEAWLAQGDSWAFLQNLEELLHIAAEVGITANQMFTKLAFDLAPEPGPQVQQQFFRNVPLPPGLHIEHLRKAMNQTQSIIARINRNLRFSTGVSLNNFIQANNFSGVVSNIFTDALNQISPYEHNHEQRFPDLKNPSNDIGLEIKASNKPGKGGESHNGHSGWHLVACFMLDSDSGNILFVHIEVAELVGYIHEEEGDWHYCGSTVDTETGSQRTETYYTTGRGTSKLRDGSVYLDTCKVTNWQRWRHNKSYPIPPHSPLYFQRIDNQRRVPALNDPEHTVLWSTVKSQLNALDLLWPLYQREELLKLGLPLALVDVIRPLIA